MERTPMNRLGGLWQQKDKNGNTYFSGKFGDKKIKIFKNSYKKGEKDPDWILYETEVAAPKSNQPMLDATPNPDDEPF